MFFLVDILPKFQLRLAEKREKVCPRLESGIYNKRVDKMEAINKNNIKTLKSILKLLENNYTKWPPVIEAHKIAVKNAIQNAVDSCEIVMCNGGIKTIVDNIEAFKKVDLFSELEQQNQNLNTQNETA